MTAPDDLRPPIPLSLANRPVTGGLAQPWVNVQLAGGGVDFRSTHRTRFDEPPVCPPCALYASRGCPMVSGRTVTYPDRPRVVDGARGEKCEIPGCDCGGWQNIDPEHSADMGGQPALPWYALWIHPAAYQVTAHPVRYRCSDRGCEHERLVVNGAQLLLPPRKILLAAEPGNGRIWRKLTSTEACAHAREWLAGLGQEVPAETPMEQP